MEVSLLFRQCEAQGQETSALKTQSLTHSSPEEGVCHATQGHVGDKQGGPGAKSLYCGFQGRDGCRGRLGYTGLGPASLMT